MASTTFISRVTKIAREWLQDVNDCVYGPTAPTTTLRGQLASTASAADGAGLVKASHNLNYVAATLGAKFKEKVSVKDHPFLAKLDGVTDDTSAVNAAIAFAASAGYSIEFPAGHCYINGTVNLANKVCITGAGKAASEIWFGPSGSFTLTGTSGSPIGYLTIEKLGLTNQGGGPTYCATFNYATRVSIVDCVVYNTGLNLNGFNYFIVERCDLFSGTLFATHPTVNVLSEALKVIRCQGSGFKIDVQNTADVFVDGCSMLGGQTQISVQRGTQPATYYTPVFISNSVIDAGNDEGIRLYGACPHITNVWTSSGRTNLKDGIYLEDCKEGAVVNAQSRFNGRHGLHIDNCSDLSISDSTFNDNKNYGININNSTGLRFMANQMNAVGAAWFGGGYAQVKGISDDAANCTGIVFVGNKCSGNSSVDVNLPSTTNLLIGNTGTGATNSKSLNTYVPGTFTPVIQGGTTAGVGTYATQAGAYTKIGNVCTVTGFVSVTAHTGTGSLQIGGLPFTSKNQANLFQPMTLAFVSNIALTAGNYAQAIILPNTTTAGLVQSATGGGGISNVPMDAVFDLAFSATYITET